MRETTAGFEGLPTAHPLQVVLHGPVVYRDSVYEALAQAGDERARTAASIFTKARKYADQREYRFAVFNGGSGDETVSLQISGMMRDALKRAAGTDRGKSRGAGGGAGERRASGGPLARTGGRHGSRESGHAGSTGGPGTDRAAPGRLRGHSD